MHRYLITSKDFYTDDKNIFSKILTKQILKHSPSHVLFRDKTNLNYAELAATLISVCDKFNGLKSFIHQDVELAKRLGATGVHLTSSQFNEITKAKKLSLKVIISTHTKEEILKAREQEVYAVTYSPIFKTPDKGEPKGVLELEEVVKSCDINIFALGGITTQEQVEMVEKTACYGFASIRYFAS
jgi:thiamine-phosphate pyrophosphorylase